MDDIHYLNLVDIGRLIQTGALSAVHVAEHCLERIRAFDNVLNSYIAITEDMALAAAEQADREIRSSRCRGPLHGVPIALKDMCDLAGTPTTAGMRIRRFSMATDDATVVRKLKEAGAVILGKTNLTEGVYGDHREPFGAPVNPWSADRWPGASSSGSGVAVAAGLCYAAISSDTGGSIRLPSAVNGVTGLKPTWGRVSRHGIFELAATLDHVGPMARSAADVAAVLSVIAGADKNDPTAAPEPVSDYSKAVATDVAGLSIGIDQDWVSQNADAATVSTLYDSLEVLRSLGARTIEVTFPDPRQAIEDWFDICAVQAAINHQSTYSDHRSEYGPALSALLDRGQKLSGIDYHRTLARRAEFSDRVHALFQTIDVLALPVLAFPVPTTQQMEQLDEALISGLHCFTCPFTMAGIPTITMPGGFARDGMPVAVQFAGPKFGENRLVRLGSAFQSATGWHRRRPDFDRRDESRGPWSAA